MTWTFAYKAQEPTRAEVDSMTGLVVIEFGTAWCGHCQAAQPLLESVLSEYPDVEHLKIEDGKGKPLGRSYRIKLWPTLIFLRDGQESERLVRPVNERTIREALGLMTS